MVIKVDRLDTRKKGQNQNQNKQKQNLGQNKKQPEPEKEQQPQQSEAMRMGETDEEEKHGHKRPSEGEPEEDKHEQKRQKREQQKETSSLINTTTAESNINTTNTTADNTVTNTVAPEDLDYIFIELRSKLQKVVVTLKPDSTNDFAVMQCLAQEKFGEDVDVNVMHWNPKTRKMFIYFRDEFDVDQLGKAFQFSPAYTP